MRRHLVLATTATLVSLSCLAAQGTEVFQGKVVAAGDQRIAIERQAQATLIFQIASNASLTRDGKKVRLEDLKKTDQATVTTDNRMLAIVVDVRSTQRTGRAMRVSRLSVLGPTNRLQVARGSENDGGRSARLGHRTDRSSLTSLTPTLIRGRVD